MTEKRFVYDDFDDVIKDTYTQKEYDYHIGELELIVEEINNIHEENKKLQERVSNYADICACSIQVMNEDEELKADYSSILCNRMYEIIEENNELKNENANLLGAIDLLTKNLEKQFNRKKELYEQIDELSDENEQLKQKNKLLYEDIDFLKRFIEKRGFKAKLESDKR